MFKLNAIKTLRLIMGVGVTLMGASFTYIVAATPAK